MIVTDRLTLRDWREADIAALATIHSDPDVMRFLGGAKSYEETARTVNGLRRKAALGQPIFWAVERSSDATLVGAAGLNLIGREYPFGPAMEVGWRLGRDFWGQGYATEAGAAALAHAFGVLGADRVYAFSVRANQPSHAVMHRIGMTKVQGGDFEHPHLVPTDPLRRHVLYVAEADSWTTVEGASRPPADVTTPPSTS